MSYKPLITPNDLAEFRRDIELCGAPKSLLRFTNCPIQSIDIHMILDHLIKNEKDLEKIAYYQQVIELLKQHGHEAPKSLDIKREERALLTGDY